jgi:serine/threonine protein phosphatase PrpC
MTDINEETKADFQTDFGRDFFADDQPVLQVEIAAATHVGKVRERNEDHYAVLRRTRGCEMLLTNLANEQEFTEDHAYVLLVADGVGGSQFGDLASELAIESLLQAARLATSWIMKFKDLDGQECQKRIGAYVDRIQDEFRKHGLMDPAKQHMGTTLTGAYLVPPHAIIAHIGDSRAYLFRDGLLTQVTRDQTLSQAFIDAGVEKERSKCSATC